MPVIRHAANWFPLHTARCATMRSVVSVSSRAIGVRTHGATGTISSVSWSASPAAALVCSPASLACEEGVVEAVEGTGACAVDKGSVAEERDVVEAEVPDRGVHHAVGAEGHHGTDDCTGEDVVPGENVSVCVTLCSWVSSYQLWNSSIVSAPPIKTAPRRGA
jgi:hypothetical protein